MAGRVQGTALCRWPSVASALAIVVGLTGCPSSEPEEVDVPPGVPGQACEPGLQRCLDQDTLEICRADGRGWFEKDCSTGAVCDSNMAACISTPAGCVSGEAKCTGNPGTAARSVCDAQGSAWSASPCEGAEVCDPTSGSCATPLCAPGESMCTGGDADPDRSTCSADRLSFVHTPCPDSTVCVATPGGSKCASRICDPGEDVCSDDFQTVLRCDATGTTFGSVAECSENEACQLGSCEPSDNPLGDPVRVNGVGSLSLSPGSYLVAVVHFDVTGDDTIDYPITVSGTVTDPNGLVSHSIETRPSMRIESGTKALLRTRLPIRGIDTPPAEPVAYDDDERVFHVPDHTSGGTSVLPRTARLRASGQYVDLWEDQSSGPGVQLPDAILGELVQRIDTAVMPRTAVMMGPPSDVDSNGKVDILFTDVLPDSVAAFVFPSATLFPPGSYAVDYDHGEVVYTHGLTMGQTTSEVATLMAHEIAQLTYLADRLVPYLPDPESIPEWVHADLYAVEGLASVAMGWSGQSWTWPAVTALRQPQDFSLWRLTVEDYIQDPDANLVSYGFGALVQEYLFDQAGGMKVQGAGSVFEDAGGRAFVQAFTAGQSGWDRIVPVDGRPLTEWYVDFATALLLYGQEQRVSAATASESRYRFAETTEDPVFGGMIGPTLRYEHVGDATESGPILRIDPWSQRPSELRRGGMSFISMQVGESGGALSVSEAGAAAVVIRLSN